MITAKYNFDQHTLRVYIGGVPLDPGASQAIYNHSPDGFSAGYNGSGPAQLALAILLHYTDEQTAVRHYQRFKAEIIADLDPDGFSLPERTVKRWLAEATGNK
jgi:hypothetical protein